MTKKIHSGKWDDNYTADQWMDFNELMGMTRWSPDAGAGSNKTKGYPWPF